jgi:eukaryotic-like serine/threonine-protein kinase
VGLLGAATGEAPSAPRKAGVVTGTGQRVVSVLLVEPEGPSDDATLTSEHVEAARAEVQKVAERFGGEATALGSGAVVVILRGTGAATDQASKAAACALAMAKALPEARVALATGRAETAGGTPLGPALEGAAALLSSAEGGEVRIDTVTAALLDPRFEVQEGCLVGERADEGRVRRLLGKPTPCVGRRTELAMLESILDECIEESAARVVLVTAPAGAGKSRLRHELTERLRERGDRLTVLMARAHPVGAGSALMLVRQLVRSAAGLEADGDPEAQYTKVCAYVEGLGVEHPDRTAEFLGEVAGYPKPGEATMQLRGARNDPRLMAEWMERTVSEWIGAEARRRPLLLALEDLHWGDLATVNYLARALRKHPEQPWMVLALARPEADEVFPKLWSDAEPQRLELTGLSRRAAEQLVRAVLGDDVSAETLGRIVERAGGNAFYLEELIRHAAEGGADLPDTVLAMVQSRLEALEPEARRVLQVASVFGETFREAGVEALLGGESAPMDVGGWLEHLVDVEMLEHGHGATAAAAELTFRHALVRDAAYALIAEADKRTAHLAAAEWLEQEPASDPRVLIEHFEKAGAPERAIAHYLRAAEQAYGAGDMEATCDLCERGRRAGADGEVRGHLIVVEGYAESWLGRWDRAWECSDQALSLLPSGSTVWYQAAGGKVYVAANIGRPALALETLAQLVQIEEIPDATGWTGHAAAMVVQALAIAGQRDLACQQIERMERAARRHSADKSYLGYLCLARAFYNLYYIDDVGRAVILAREACLLFAEAGDESGAEATRFTLGYALINAGACDEAVEVCDPATTAQRLSYTGSMAEAVRTMANVELGHEPWEALRNLGATRSTDLRAMSRLGLASMELARGGHDVVLEMTARAVERPLYILLFSFLAIRSAAFLGTGDARAALAVADKGVAALADAASFPFSRSALLLVRAEALMALGRDDEAREAIRVARDRLLRIHASVPDDLKAGYLTGLRAHRRTMELAHDWLGEG